MRDDETTHGVGRRDAIKGMAAAIALPMLGTTEQTAVPPVAPPAVPHAAPQAAPTPLVQLTRGVPRGDAWDPDMQHPSKDWPRKLTTAEMTTLAALADMIIPKDAHSPSASTVGAHLYINEHVSAPGASYERDLVRVRGGVSWINLESEKRFSAPFAKCSLEQKTAICDDICYLPKAKEEFKAGARFFSLVRNLVGTAFYTTDAGMKDVGFVGNVALPKWELPPAEIRAKLGI